MAQSNELVACLNEKTCELQDPFLNIFGLLLEHVLPSKRENVNLQART